MIQPLHIHAQDAAVFVLIMWIVIAIAVWRDVREEEKEDKNVRH